MNITEKSFRKVSLSLGRLWFNLKCPLTLSDFYLALASNKSCTGCNKSCSQTITDEDFELMWDTAKEKCSDDCDCDCKKKCDCGAEKAGTTHANWCSTKCCEDK